MGMHRSSVLGIYDAMLGELKGGLSLRHGWAVVDFSDSLVTAAFADHDALRTSLSSTAG